MYIGVGVGLGVGGWVWVCVCVKIRFESCPTLLWSNVGKKICPTKPVKNRFIKLLNKLSTERRITQVQPRQPLHKYYFAPLSNREASGFCTNDSNFDRCFAGIKRKLIFSGPQDNS